MGTKNLAIVLPMYNEQKGLPKAFQQIRQVVDGIYPEFLSRLFVFVDGATDNTNEMTLLLAKLHQLPINYHYHPKNLGLGLTTKPAFDAALYCRNDYVLKTDVDGDFDIGEVVRKLTKESKSGADAVIGVRRFAETGAYEAQRRQHVLGVLEREFGTDAKALDPAQVGSYIYKAEALEKIIQDNAVKYFVGKWGFDFLLALLAYSKGLDIKTISLPNKRANSHRRDNHKVLQQYNAYLAIIAAVRHGLSSEVLSLLKVQE